MRVAIADHHQLFREAIKRLLESLAGVKIVGECSSGEEAVELVRSITPDILITEVLMPGIGGLEALHRIKLMQAGTRVVVLTAQSHAPFPTQMLRAGASGFLTKNISLEELDLCLRRVYFGRRYICEDVAQELAQYSFGAAKENPFDSLSQREMQVMLMVVNCVSAGEIAKSLNLSAKTVNSYRYRIFDKLDINGDVAMTLMAVEHGIVARQSTSNLPPLPTRRRTEGDKACIEQVLPTGGAGQ